MSFAYRKLASYALILSVPLIGDCKRTETGIDRPVARFDDEMVVCGRRVPIGAPVVRWDQTGGFNAYIEHRTSGSGHVLPINPAPGCDTPERYGTRACFLGDAIPPSRGLQPARILRQAVDQIVLHYDAAGTSRRCFEVLHDDRGLSAHFLLDTDGVIYQTLDVSERARHAGRTNDRSIGIEIANIGAYESVQDLQEAYDRARLDPPPGNQPPMVGYIKGRRLNQPPFTDAQYDSLIKLTRALCRELPRIRRQAPLDKSGRLVDAVLSDAERDRFRGILGHYHVSSSKVDPGPAFDWPRFLRGLR